MKKIRIGVMGAYRGTGMINYCRASDNAEVVAICDKWVEGLRRQKENLQDENITYYTTFDEFIKHDMDAVVLANYANEHAPFAIRALRAGKHVFSEVLPVQTMKEAVELIEAVEETGLTYAYGENYCYIPSLYEMRKLYRKGKVGEFEYGECEYIHNCEPIWPSITYGDPTHWRNNMYSTYYCTHSLGPIIHITGLRPVSVIGMEGTKTERNLRTGSKAGQFGIEMVTLDNGGIVKSIHGGLYRSSYWYSLYGSKGRMETARPNARQGSVQTLHVDVDTAGYGTGTLDTYKPAGQFPEKAEGFGHDGADFYCLYNFVEKLLGNPEADIIDVYEAMDMGLPGMFAYRSILAGGVTMEIPNLRDKSVRDAWRNDVTCVDPAVAGDMWIPSFSKGNPDIPDAVYEEMKRRWREEFESNTGYTKMAFNQSSGKK